MYKTKLMASILLIAAVLFAQVGVVAAAAPAQDTTIISGVITDITIQTDTTGTTVLVTLIDGNGVEQTVSISVEKAVTLGLVTLDPVTKEPVVNEDMFDQTVEIDMTPEEPTEEVPVHPIAALLAEFFDVDGSVIDGYHQDGYGFGLIAQALWMSKNIGETDGGDAELAGCILEAKQSGMYGECFDFGEDPVPTNWGQFKKVYSEKKNNLGVVVSGKAEKDETTDPASLKEHGNGKEKNEDKGNNGNGHGKP